jgi:diaminopimelate decarboxylase
MTGIDAYKDLLPVSSTVSPDGHLSVGGCNLIELADRFGTPMIVLDRKTFDANATGYASSGGPDRIFYAGKAFLCTAICELLDGLGLGLDVCSGGELTTALAAGFPSERIVFHGNNKSEAELTLANESGIRRIVVDSFDEIRRVEQLGVKCELMIRLTPGIDAPTHKFVQTGGRDTKFGFDIGDGSALNALKRLMEVSSAPLVGVHSHLGSQIFDLATFDSSVARIADFCALAKEDLGFEAAVVNCGGGFAIAHTSGEVAPHPAESGSRLVGAVRREFSGRGLIAPDVELEPGRSIVGPAGMTVYRVGTVKRIAGVRTYVSVDGGMSDNIRPALYGARYEAVLGNRMQDPLGTPVTVSGKHCESGDVLIHEAHLPDDVAVGDLLCIPATGAYTYALASTYNRVPRPPVVLVDEGSATVIVRRETNEDLLSLDRRLDGSRSEAGTRRRKA